MLFKSKYGTLPGDLSNATSYWPAMNTANGNGDGQLDINVGSNSPLEDVYAWNHLSLSGLITGNYKSGLQNIRYGIGINMPYSILGNNTGYMITTFTPYGYPSGYLLLDVALELGSYDSLKGQGLVDSGVLTPQDVYVVDKKADDGNPAAGVIRVASGWDIDNQGFCVNTGANSSSSQNVQYILTDKTPSCRLFYIVRAN